MTKKKDTPRGIHFEMVGADEIRMYKVWSRKYTSKEPFLIIGADFDEFLNELYEYYKKWNLKPDMKKVKKFLNEHNK